MSALGDRLTGLSNRMYDRMRDPAAFTAARGEATAHGFAALRGAKYCLLVSYRRSGEPVPTPVWFGLDDEGRLYVRSEADVGKVKRIRANPRVRVAPANSRGKPTGPLAEGTARVLAPHESAPAELVLQANYGPGRKLYEALGAPLGVERVYLEVTPA
ncbi:MAG TPA: PPOX class F420-dependent oxidoreductase [Solirubrobacteraceae bacterium]|jgi:PPOX class probable F420-dependent enzyme|nr:PPOX class F420-dependent oxidoreductase [Solirubrobacteraceae bacterium]